MPNMRKRHSETSLNTSLFSVLSVRLREGYTIRDISITKGRYTLLSTCFKSHVQWSFITKGRYTLLSTCFESHVQWSFITKGRYRLLSTCFESHVQWSFTTKGRYTLLSTCFENHVQWSSANRTIFWQTKSSLASESVLIATPQNNETRCLGLNKGCFKDGLSLKIKEITFICT